MFHIRLAKNIMLIALKSDNKPVFNSSNPELNGYLQHLYKEAIITSEAILTDDFAPVEYYVRKFL